MKYKTDMIRFAAAVTLAGVLLTGCSKELPEQTTAPGQTQAQIQPTVQTQPTIAETEPQEVTETTVQRLELTVDSVEQEDQMMAVTTSYCVVRYPFAFSDLIRVAAENQENNAALLFSAYLDQTEYPMFRIDFDGTGGIPVGTLTLDDGTVVSVTAQIFQADEALEPDMLQTFYAAQESINDVLSSLTDMEGFVPVQ